MQVDVYCARESKVGCSHCGRSLLVEDLKFELSHSLLEPGGKTSSTGHFYCPCGKCLAYQQAEGRIIISDPAQVYIIDS